MYLIVLIKSLCGAIAALGFAVIFNVPKRTLVPGAICGALAVCIRTLLLEAEVVPEWAALFAALGSTSLAVYFRHRLDTPTKVIAVPGVIPLVPGMPSYDALLGAMALVTATKETAPVQLALVVKSGLRATFIVFAITLGVTIPTALYRRAFIKR